MLNASISQQNIFGSGNALGIGVNTSRYNRQYSMILTEPYYTVDGVSRTIELYQKSLDPTGLAIAQYGSKTLGAALGFGVPITETDTINFGGRFEQTDITLFADTPPVYVDFVNQSATVSQSAVAIGLYLGQLTRPSALTALLNAETIVLRHKTT